MKQLLQVIFLFLITQSLYAANVLDFTKTIHCTYQKGQVLSTEEYKNVFNSRPLNWTFNDLHDTDKSLFISGGDVGRVISMEIVFGYAIVLPMTMGVSTFTIWHTGKSFWNKQDMFITIEGAHSQQFIGKCVN